LAAFLKQDAKPDAVTVRDFVDHIDYAVKRIGIEHVGISSDFDGGGWFTGWRDASESANLTVELLSRGYDRQEIAALLASIPPEVLEPMADGLRHLAAAAGEVPEQDWSTGWDL